MLQRLGIRGKILAVVAVPVLVLLLVAGFVTYTATQDLAQTRNTEVLLDTVESAGDLATAFQNERWNTLNYLHSIQHNRGQLLATRTEIDRLATGIADFAAGSGNSGVRAAAAAITAVLDGEHSERSWEELGTIGPVEAPVDPTITDPTMIPGQFPLWPGEAEIEAMVADYDEMIAAYNARVTNVPSVTFTIPEFGDFNTRDSANLIVFLLARERDERVTYLTEPLTYEAELEAAFTQVDTQYRSFNQAVNSIPDNEQNERILLTISNFQARYSNVEDKRDLIRSRRENIPSLSGWYREIMGDLVAIPNDAAATTRDGQVAQVLFAYAAQNQLIERMQEEKSMGERLLRAGFYQTGELIFVRRTVARTDLALEDAQRLVNAIISDPETQAPNFGSSRVFGIGDGNDFSSIRQVMESGLEGSLRGERQFGWPGRVDAEVAVQEPARTELLRIANQEVAQASQTTFITTVVTAILAVAVVVISLIVAFVISRRIVGPLRRLTTTATAVRQELPRLVERVALPGEQVDVSEVQIPVESRDEVGRLAEAFNSVNAATLAIAGEQAALRGSISEMFVNVARRDQVLLNRQLASIDEMERTQDDPETLRRLFALDHLATRMRRNSESLLVLAGIDTGRRLRRPMPLSDVIRTASSEIELYERVQLELDADPAMLGHSALTAAHLYAELLENATVFSDPGTPVIVRTSERGGNYVVEVVDSGIGMTPDELREANARVASTAASEILGAQRLGLFVVGRIARRIGARVEIFSKEGDGTVATVTMPPSLFDPNAAVDMTHTVTTAADTEMGAPAALTRQRDDEEQTTPGTGVDIGSYQPVAFEQAAPSSEPEVEEAIPVPMATVEDAPAMGLPTRRRKASEAEDSGADAEGNVLGLPARATDEQMAALAQETSGFTPAVSASEVSPQSAEERAQMFRGFRARKDAEAVAEIAPDAESLGQAVRRGAVDPESIPSLEDDDDTPSIVVEPADARHDAEPVSSQSPLISTGYDHADTESGGISDPSAVPALEEDEEPVIPEPQPLAPSTQQAPGEPAVAQQPVYEAPHAGVEQVSLNDTPDGMYQQPQYDQGPMQQFTGPSMDDLISGAPSEAQEDQSGFFGKLFGKGRGHEDQGPQSGAPQAPAYPMDPVPVDSATQGMDVPEYIPPAEQPWSDGTPRPPADMWGQPAPDAYQAPPSMIPSGSAMPYNPGNPGTPAPMYSPDQLANPGGWELAGANAIEASQPEFISSYTPVVDLQPSERIEPEQDTDVTSEVFSELSSLSSERPKVERTKAGLTKRTPQSMPAPAAAPVPRSTPTERDPEHMRQQFSSFYSGTQRAREDVAELERQNQPAAAKE